VVLFPNPCLLSDFFFFDVLIAETPLDWWLIGLSVGIYSAGGIGTIPFLLEDELQKLGGNYERTEDWGVKVVVDGKLYTGQNPASAGPLAERIKKDLLA
jgi:putative intracellular protease/amidase